MSDDPWVGLVPPVDDRRLSALRVDSGLAWNFFWAVGFEGETILFLDHSSAVTPVNRLPQLRGVEVTIESTPETGVSRMLFRLREPELRSVFLRLCLDVIHATRTAHDEAEVLGLTLSRTLHWHYLLSSGRSSELAPFEQQGLIAELIILRDVLFATLSMGPAIACWTGPRGTAKDFEIGAICIEVKARRPGARSFIRISSEDQLDDSRFDDMYLYVVDVIPVPSSTPVSYSLPDLIDQIRESVQIGSPVSVEAFDSLLIQRGFSWNHDYKAQIWEDGKIDIFKIAPGFPRIIANDLLPGVSDVQYAIGLRHCVDYQVSESTPISAIRRSADAVDRF